MKNYESIRLAFNMRVNEEVTSKNYTHAEAQSLYDAPMRGVKISKRNRSLYDAFVACCQDERLSCDEIDSFSLEFFTEV